MPSAEPYDPSCFELKDCALIALATGEKAQNLKELKEGLTQISPDSIYYHFWGSLLRSGFEDPQYHNDFAAWSAHILHDKVLAERLAVIDPNRFGSLELLRRELVEVVEERLDEIETLSWSPRDEQFEFIRSHIVVFKTNRIVQTPEALGQLLPTLSAGCIFYHFIDARRRTVTSQDDFSLWLEQFGKDYRGLIQNLAEIDPYFVSLTRLRENLVSVFASHLEESA